MKQFFKFMFASMLGFFLMWLVIVTVVISIFAAAITFGKSDKVEISDNSLLYLKLDQPIEDRASNNPFSNFSSFSNKKATGLNDIIKCIKAAKNDNKIKGIFLELDNVPSGIATVEEIRNALLDFKTSKKFIISYSEGYSQKAYYLATTSDEIVLNPEGILAFRGMGARLMFFKGSLEKLEIEPEVIRHGKFKSAVEPFTLDKMSDANREQTKEFVGSIWNTILKGISETRKISVCELNLIADSLKLSNSGSALKYKMIDKIMYKDEVLARINEKLKVDKDAKVKLVCINSYLKSPQVISSVERNIKYDKIAVIYASGDIVSGEGNDEEIGSEKFSNTIREARLDKKVKAVVLRINSPGGSALASEVIWREIELTKKVKPVVVSMGNVAASGGYYIACPANKIIAQPNTITGSIGVFGILFNAKKFMNNKLGITIDNVNTNAYSDIGSSYRPLSNFERMKIQSEIERIYDTFLAHVAEGRKLTKAQVDSIGQGRVWSGVDAKRIGLIDDFGDLQKAIEVAADLAKLKNYRIQTLPKQKETLEQIMELINSSTETKIMKNELGEYYKYLQNMKSILSMDKVQARMPFVEVE
ncbi:MAG: signal peptide peptidase SppA [Bacteroidales bacterium]|nr:signal peptide peptidase SppA [Bacteroidales bacterium]